MALTQSQGKDFFLESSRVGLTQCQDKNFFLYHFWSVLRHPHTSLPLCSEMFPGGSDISRSLFQQKRERLCSERKEGSQRRAMSQWEPGFLCWNGIKSPFKRAELTELQPFSYFCGNNSSNLQASAHQREQPHLAAGM